MHLESDILYESDSRCITFRRPELRDSTPCFASTPEWGNKNIKFNRSVWTICNVCNPGRRRRVVQRVGRVGRVPHARAVGAPLPARARRHLRGGLRRPPAARYLRGYINLAALKLFYYYHFILFTLKSNDFFTDRTLKFNLRALRL